MPSFIITPDDLLVKLTVNIIYTIDFNASETKFNSYFILAGCGTGRPDSSSETFYVETNDAS